MLLFNLMLTKMSHRLFHLGIKIERHLVVDLLDHSIDHQKNHIKNFLSKNTYFEHFLLLYLSRSLDFLVSMLFSSHHFQISKQLKIKNSQKHLLFTIKMGESSINSGMKNALMFLYRIFLNLLRMRLYR